MSQFQEPTIKYAHSKVIDVDEGTPLSVALVPDYETGSYKAPTILASTCSALSFTMLLIFWRQELGVWECLLIMPAGLATGVAHPAVFVGLTSAVQAEEIAIVGSGLYLSRNIGGVTGVSGAAAAFQIALQANLKHALQGREHSSKIIHTALSDIYYIRYVPEGLRTAMLPAYISATQTVFLLALAASVTALLFGIFLKEKPFAEVLMKTEILIEQGDFPTPVIVLT